MEESVETAGVACCIEDWAALDSLLGSPVVLDRDCQCESPLPTPPVSGAATVEGEKRPRKKRRQDRNRPGHEIARLKVQAIEMERRVEKLLAAADGSTHDLLRSCKDNRGLKTHLQWSLEHTAAFERILSSQADRALQALPNTSTVSGRNLMYEPIQDDAVFQVLARAVDHQYKETSRVFRVAELQNVTSDVFDAHACRSRKASSRGIGDCILKSRTSRLLPFESHDVENAMLRMLESEAVLLPKHVHPSGDLELSLGLASRIFVTKREVVLGDAIFTVRLAMKQFTEADRVVFVWSAVADWLNVGTTRSASTREHGWSSIKPAVCPGMSSTQSFVLVTPTTSATGSNRSGVIESTIRMYLLAFDSRHQTLENTLMDLQSQKK